MIPEFICHVYEEEVRKVVNQVIDHISTRFSLDKDDIATGVEKNIQMKLEIIPESEQTFKIQKKTTVAAENRCIARIKKKGLYCQCAFKKVSDDLCTRHGKADVLKWGTINDELPKENLKRRTRNMV